METGFAKAIRWLVWPVTIIVAINIENWATAHGYGSLWSQHIQPYSLMADVIEIVTQPIWRYLISFIAGAMFIAWGEHFFQRLNGHHEGPPMWYNVSNIDTAMTLLRKKKNGLISPVASINRANESLVRLNLPAIPLEVVEDFDLRHEYSAYLAALIPLLKLKKLEAAEELAIALDGTIRSRSGVRQSLQGTGSETPL